MASQFALPIEYVGFSGWTVLFAREPEPDPDLDDIPTDSMDRGRSGLAPAPPPRRSGRGPLILFLLLLIVAGATYLYMEPETLRGVLPESVMDLLGEGPPSSSSQPNPEPGQPAPPPLASGPAAKDEKPPAMPAEPLPPAAPGATAPPPPVPPVPPGEPSRPETVPGPPAVAGSVPEPRFGEGQIVTVKRDASTPGQLVSLTGDAAGTKPGPMVRPGTAVRVLDGDFQNNAWVYSVKTPEGAKGWLSEERLQSQP